MLSEPAAYVVIKYATYLNNVTGRIMTMNPIIGKSASNSKKCNKLNTYLLMIDIEEQ